VPRAELEELLGLVAYCSQASPVLAACTTHARAVLSATAQGHYAPLGEGARAEIGVWDAVLTEWNGVSIVPRAVIAASAAVMYSDACRTGIGFIIEANGVRIYCSEGLPPDVSADEQRYHINLLELLAAYLCVVAAADFGAISGAGAALRGARMMIDNTVAIAAADHHRTSSTALQPLTRALAVACARHQITPLPLYVPSLQNPSDPLSRGCIPQRFTIPAERWVRVRYPPSQLRSLLECKQPWLAASAPLATARAAASSTSSASR